ncbi:IS3 family transposase [Nocardia sp. CA-290969]|uniref:IS3 family transposase n=1 Tax=Nocardia sp. CA-290969 TaxID=3239986 RepID=UPI003D8AF9C8
MIVRFVKDSRHPVELVLRVLGIASSTYYWWCKRLERPSSRQIADEALLAEIVDIHTSSGGTYGSPRVHAMLARCGGGLLDRSSGRTGRRAQCANLCTVDGGGCRASW